MLNNYNICTIISAQDWHPADHISFFSNLGLRQLDPTWLSVNNTNVADIGMFDEVDIYSIYTIYLPVSTLSIYLHNIYRSCSRGILPTDRSCGQITAFRAQTVGVNVANMQKIFIIY